MENKMAENMSDGKEISPGKTRARKHNYTSELELKSLLIRIKNDRFDRGVCEFNSRINKYIALYDRINSKKYDDPSKRNFVKARIKQRIISDSEKTRINHGSYERFGEIILLMIKNILRKPQFSGYTYRDDFYSDAVYKITKYLHNFDHTKISMVSGQSVNAFAYISQYIHNSVIYIIKKKKKESDKMKKRIQMENLNHDLQLKNYELIASNHFRDYESVSEDPAMAHIRLELKEVNSLVEEVERIQEKYVPDLPKWHPGILVIYPSDYRISFDEYEMLKPYLSSISLERKRIRKDFPESPEDIQGSEKEPTTEGEK